MHFEISRGTKPYNRVTTAQRTSSLYAEEPIVMGKILRRGGAALKLDETQFRRQADKLKRLLKAGAIEIWAVYDDGKRVSVDESGKIHVFDSEVVTGEPFPTLEEIAAQVEKDGTSIGTISEPPIEKPFEVSVTQDEENKDLINVEVKLDPPVPMQAVPAKAVDPVPFSAPDGPFMPLDKIPFPIPPHVESAPVHTPKKSKK